MDIVVVGTVILALIYDPSGTVKLVATSLSIRGVTWVTKKITENINRDASQIIDFAGWSMAGVSIVKIIGNAMGSVNGVKDVIVGVSDKVGKMAEIIDKITFWN